jgi:hypothetical protein
MIRDQFYIEIKCFLGGKYLMQLVYINETFLKYIPHKDKSGVTSGPSIGELRALFFDDEKKTWGNSHVMDERRKLDFIKNQNEFNERKWLLAKKNAETDAYIHEGPYSSHEIFDMLTQSQIQLSDPIWKEGQSKWLAIKQTPTFKELATLSEPVETDIADILSSIVEYDPGMHRVEEEKTSPGTPNEVFIIFDDK